MKLMQDQIFNAVIMIGIYPDQFLLGLKMKKKFIIPLGLVQNVAMSRN